MGLHLSDKVEIDDRRAMHALKSAWIQALLKVLHGFAKNQGIIPGLDAHVIAGSVDSLDSIDIDPENLPLILDIDHLFKAVGQWSIARTIGELFRSGRRVLDQSFLQPFRLFRAFAFGQSLSNSVKRCRKPVLIDRLHQVIHGLRLERPQSVVPVSGHEHKEGRFHVHKALDYREAVEAWHLDVEKNQVRFVSLDRAYRLSTVHCGCDDFNVVMGLEAQLQTLSRKRLVIDQYGPDAH
jgi:hypothetical protein